MIYTYKELLVKYKSAYQIEKAVKNGEFHKIKKGIYSDIPSAHYLAVIMKKYPYGVFTSYSAYYYHNLTDVIPNKIYLATNRNATTITSKKIQQIRMKDELYNLGKTQIDYEGTKINIYDKERMLIDLARNKNNNKKIIVTKIFPQYMTYEINNLIELKNIL